MFTISLHNLSFFSFHGMHEEERILGNNYLVNIELTVDADENIKNIEQTVNYATVYQLIKQRMLIPTPLLETLAQDLAQQIHTMDDRIRSISVTVEKKDPPIANMQGSVSVNYKKDF